MRRDQSWILRALLDDPDGTDNRPPSGRGLERPVDTVARAMFRFNNRSNRPISAVVGQRPGHRPPIFDGKTEAQEEPRLAPALGGIEQLVRNFRFVDARLVGEGESVTHAAAPLPSTTAISASVSPYSS